MKKRAVVVFAAGSGTRMKSSTPKVLHTIAGKSMIDHILETGASLDASQIVLIASPNLLSFIETHPKSMSLPVEKVTLALQEEALGSGHAMRCALPHLHKDIEEVIVLFGDVPLIQKETVEALFSHTAPLAMLGMRVAPPHAYGRMFTHNDVIDRIVEFKDATPEELKIDLVWTGVLKASRAMLEDYLPKLKPSPVTGEDYLTGLVALLRHDNLPVSFHVAENPEEFEGVNDKLALSIMEGRFQNRVRKQMLLEGVKMIAPETVFVSHDTIIEEDVVIHPFVTLGTGVHIKKGATILSHTHIEDSVIGEDASIGPFAHLRGGNVIDKHASIGNFVEVKKSHLSKKAKVKHLSYIGDAHLQEGVNVGAGTITCNYDGKNKHQTTIGEGSFIGANTTLVAPLSIGKNTKIAAGSVITQDVPDNKIAFGRAKQENKEKKKD